MSDQTLSSKFVTFEHVTIECDESFASVKASLEGMLPAVDNEIFLLLHDGDAAGAMRKIEAAPTLSIFGMRDYSALLMVTASQTRAAMQYEIGNPLTASKMAREVISAAIYAPIRVLLREDTEGIVAFEYDRPMSVFGQFGNEIVNIVARELDENLRSVLEEAASQNK